MLILQITLSDLLWNRANNPAGDPAFWACPIQWGIPQILSVVEDLLLYVGAAAFALGIFLSIYYYLTAYGSEDKAKRGQDTLKWTIIGAIVIILSKVVIGFTVDFFVASGTTVGREPNCVRARELQQQTRDLRKGLQESGIKPGFSTGLTE